ncbi:MAG: hypothetical protein IKC50_02235 [Oscillospiraceae bacterium]|nr:hypothetical protein [Oscillospiraceae bacterium]MBR2977077.1 hypothetical protein [Oscillospiraceae bacterium]
MSRYIPQPAYPDMMPVDISFVFEEERPAGKRGFVRADGEDLRFEDGTLARFWGVNFNGGACFPDRDYAVKVARRLAQAGCNLVRFHQLDAEWDTPNIFSYSKGRRLTTTRRLDEKSMDALDYLIHCLKEEGIYCYLDMSTYRHYKEGDGVMEYELLPDNARPWSMVDPRMIELQKEFATQIWTHVNPYTGLAYKDDPVFVLTEIINECDLFSNASTRNKSFRNCPFHENQFREFMRDWLAENGLSYDWENADPYGDVSETMLSFKVHLQKKYFREMYDHMRSVGVRVPITGTNWSKANANIISHEEMDFTDSHHYFYDWKWGNTERFCANHSITSSPICFPALSRMKLAGKPFFVSEWDMPWPNSYRAESSIYYAAVGALQGWAGFAIHTYAYGTRLEDMKILGREQSSPVAGVPYREGIFSVWNDPAKFGLFYHAALMLRRGDVSPAKKKIAVQTELSEKLVNTAANTGLEQHFLASVFDNKLPEGYDELVSESDRIAVPEPGKYVSDNGELWRDLKKRIGAVDTPRTKVLYGFLNLAGPKSSIKLPPKNNFVDLNGMRVECTTDFAVIAMSSLTDAPIETSDNILISAIGRARNSDAQFDGEKLVDIGKPPILAEVVNAKITMKTDKPDTLRVWGVNAEGYYAGKCDVTNNGDGTITFEIGDELNPACYYLVVAD